MGAGNGTPVATKRPGERANNRYSPPANHAVLEGSLGQPASGAAKPSANSSGPMVLSVGVGAGGVGGAVGTAVGATRIGVGNCWTTTGAWMTGVGAGCVTGKPGNGNSMRGSPKTPSTRPRTTPVMMRPFGQVNGSSASVGSAAAGIAMGAGAG